MANPYDKAAPYLQQQPAVYKEHLSPYAETGQQAFGTSHDIYSKMASDPSAYYADIRSKYTPQRGYEDYANTPAYKALSANAAAGGYAGTEGDNYAHAKLMKELESEDWEKYLNHILGIGGTGLSGLTHIGDTGFNADSSLAQLLGGNLGSQAGLAYQSEAQKNAHKNSLIQSLIQAAGAVGGGVLGGPIGGVIGNKLGGYLGGGNKGSINSFGGGSVDSGNWNRSTELPGFSSWINGVGK